VANGHQLCGELPVHRHYLDKPPLPLAVRRSSDAWIDIWVNFAHLFVVSLLPFATAWVARTRLGSSPVVFYAGLFVCSDIAYNAFEREVLIRADAMQVSAHMRRMARRRSLGALAGFTAAMLVALVAPRVGFSLVCGALILHLRLEAFGSRP
jgi:uncharacterized membrane protein